MPPIIPKMLRKCILCRRNISINGEKLSLIPEYDISVYGNPFDWANRYLAYHSGCLNYTFSSTKYGENSYGRNLALRIQSCIKRCERDIEKNREKNQYHLSMINEPIYTETNIQIKNLESEIGKMDKEWDRIIKVFYG